MFTSIKAQGTFLEFLSQNVFCFIYFPIIKYLLPEEKNIKYLISHECLDLTFCIIRKHGF